MPLHRLQGPVVLATLLAAAELGWRVVAHRWDAVKHIGAEVVQWLHPDIPPSPDAAEIASSYSHALWLLMAIVLACAMLSLTKATIKPDLWVPSRWVTLVPTVAVAALVLAFLWSAETRLTPVERAVQAEREQAAGTGLASYERVLALLSHCHDAIRKRLAGKAVVTIDGGLVPARSYIYTYAVDEIPGQRFVRVVASQRELAATSAASARALMPPIDGGYQVEGTVTYSGDNPAVQYSDFRAYRCAMLVTGNRFEVRNLQINMIR